MRWFGESWNAIVCYEIEQCSTPIGHECGYCQNAIRKKDRGFLLPYREAGRSSSHIAYHLPCFMEMIRVEEHVAS